MNIKIARPSTKLENKKLELFLIFKEVYTHARQLELPPSMKIHPVFYILLLEPYKEKNSDRPA
jgi:hypothetical protein